MSQNRMMNLNPNVKSTEKSELHRYCHWKRCKVCYINFLLNMSHSNIKKSVIAIRRGHFMNSVFVNLGIYSCAVNAFLEMSTHLFLPYLWSLRIRNDFTDLLFNVCSHYMSSSADSLLLREIREPVSPWGMDVKLYMKYFIYWTAHVKSSKLWSSQLWTQFMQLRI